MVKQPPRNERLLTLASGGWLLAIAGLLCVIVIVWWAQRAWNKPPVVGDGRDPATYGFDLSNLLVSRSNLVGAGFGKDVMPAFGDPRVFTLEEAAAFDKRSRKGHQGKFLVPSDLVIGVVVHDEARAYPLRFMNWHQACNDELGGVPICVTYDPLCDSMVVFDRRVGDEVLTFGVSGLLYNSNMLYFDRREDPADESLWSQLQFRAIAGPAAERGAELMVLPARLVHWSTWQARYPQTTVLAPDMNRTQLYKQGFRKYLASDQLVFPVDPRPPADSLPVKARVVAIRVADVWHTLPVMEVIDRAGEPGIWEAQLGGVEVHLGYDDEPPAVWIESDVFEELAVVHARWFAWYAMHRDGAGALVGAQEE